MALPPLAQSKELAIQRASQLGPEKGSFTRYWVLKLGERKNYQIKNFDNGALLINDDTRHSEDTIVARITVVGDCSNEAMLAAYLHPGVTLHDPYFQTKEKEAGFSRWGFYQRTFLETEIKTCRKLPETMVILASSETVAKIIWSFSSTSVFVLIILFLFGLAVAKLIIKLATGTNLFVDLTENSFYLGAASLLITAYMIGQAYDRGLYFFLLTTGVFVSALLARTISFINHSKRKPSKK